MNEQQNTREAAIEAYENDFEDGSLERLCDRMFQLGAASVDRAGIVREALNEFFRNVKWMNGYIGQSDMSDAIDKFIAEMEKGK